MAGLVVDSVIASAVHYELDHDRHALVTRLDALGAAVRLVVGAAWAGADPPGRDTGAIVTP